MAAAQRMRPAQGHDLPVVESHADEHRAQCGGGLGRGAGIRLQGGVCGGGGGGIVNPMRLNTVHSAAVLGGDPAAGERGSALGNNAQPFAAAPLSYLATPFFLPTTPNGPTS